MTIAKAKVFWPVTIDGTNDGIVADAGGGPITLHVINGIYYSIVALAAAIDTSAGGSFVTTVSATGIVTITAQGGAAPNGLKWSNPNATMGPLLGYNATDQAAPVFTAQNQHQHGWYSNVATRLDTLPIRDTESSVVTLTMGGQTKKITETELIAREVKFEFLKPEKTFITYESTSLNQAIERWWQDGSARFRHWPDGTVEGTYDDYVLDQDTVRKFQPKRSYDKKALYEILLRFRKFVA